MKPKDGIIVKMELRILITKFLFLDCLQSEDASLQSTAPVYLNVLKIQIQGFSMQTNTTLHWSGASCVEERVGNLD